VHVKVSFMKVQFEDMNIRVYLIKHTSWRHMGSGGLVLHVLHLGTEWRWLVNFIPTKFYLQRISSWYALNWLGGPLRQFSFIYLFFRKSFTRYGNSHFYNSTRKTTTYSIYI
jgi:hypothetical protein